MNSVKKSVESVSKRKTKNECNYDLKASTVSLPKIVSIIEHS